MSEFKIAEYDEVAAEIDKIKEVSNFLPDCSTDEGYEKSKRVSLDIGKVKTKLEKARRAKKAHFIEGGKQVDSQAKIIMAKLDELQAPHMLAYKELDNLKKQREADRKQKLQDRVDYIRNLPANMADACSEEVQGAIKVMQDEPCLDFYEFATPALEARNKSLEELTALFSKKLKEEADAAELKELREKQALQDQKDREDEIKRQAAAKAEAEKNAALEREAAAKQAVIDAEAKAKQLEEQAKIDAENAEAAKVEAEKQRVINEKLAEEQRIESKRQAKIQADEAAERARLAEVKRQEDEQKRIDDEAAKREANKKHVGEVRKAAKDALMTHGITEEQAKAIVLAINSGDVPNVLIQY